jgi:hypothetical protein
VTWSRSIVTNENGSVVPQGSRESKAKYRRAMHHLVVGGMLEEAVAELCHLELVCACARMEEGFRFIELLIQLHDNLSRVGH